MSARNGCEGLMNKFGFQWPETLECQKFPESGLCVGQNSSTTETVSTTKSPNKKKPLQRFSFRCPQNLSVYNGDHKLIVAEETEPDCGAPCYDLFWNVHHQNFARRWIGGWSIICCALTLVTILTFLIDTRRFRYPERPIIFLSSCYFFIALSYIVGFFLQDMVSCSGPFVNPSKPAAHELYSHTANTVSQTVVKTLPIITQVTNLQVNLRSLKYQINILCN